MTARAGIDHSDQGAASRIFARGGGAGDRELPMLQRLAQHLQHLALELGQLVQEQHPVVGRNPLME
jgi:hypothetical protein